VLGPEPPGALPGEGALIRIGPPPVHHDTTKGSLGLPFVLWGLLPAIMLAAAGCADVSGQALQQDVAQLRQDLNSLTLAVHRGRGDTETVVGQLDRRTREQNAESSKQITALGARVDSLSAEVARLTARLDELSQRIDALGRSAPSGGGSTIPPPARSGAAPVPAPSGSVATAPRPSGGGTPEESYQAAYLDFSKGLYPLAITEFRDFLRRFPDSALSDSAQYWIGEAYFSMARATASQPDKARENLEQAVQEFRKVMVAYPRGTKVPTALYKEALALVELKQTALAQARLQYLVEHFPQSEEAPLAKERLASLKD
jgi:tol-pal system protein YbgF